MKSIKRGAAILLAVLLLLPSLPTRVVKAEENVADSVTYNTGNEDITVIVRPEVPDAQEDTLEECVEEETS
ncbi:MAG: hypothetical protein LUH19_01725, partial [Lachnospiraceae bacterium]|nr:hypothetical protein [Lachnospiraceae bacterium]